MGCSESKKKRGDAVNQFAPVISDPLLNKSFDERLIEVLREEFKNDTQTFILNNILMSMMFFENYDKEIIHIKKQMPEVWRQKISQDLATRFQKECLTPDIVMELVNRNVRFIPVHAKNNVSEPLVPQRMFVIHSNIEISDPDPNYSDIDKPTYRGNLVESKNHPGFVKVKQIKTSLKRMDDVKRYSQDSNFSEPPIREPEVDYEPSISNAAEKTDSGVNSETDYEYTRITDFRTPVLLTKRESDNYTYVDLLPPSCLTTVKEKNTDAISSDEEEDERPSTRVKMPTIEELFTTNIYINSENFLEHFKDVFPYGLGQALGFDDDDITEATSSSGIVHCRTLDLEEKPLNCEVIPAIAIPWPTEMTIEWLRRERKSYPGTSNGKTIHYRWPTENMINNIRRLNCVLIPRGYHPKRGRNPEDRIEWEVAFPKAEKFLETKMTHGQMRIYICLLAMYKTYIEPKTKRYGLLPEHFRTLIFWECENNFKNWGDHRLAQKLLYLLRILKSHVSKHYLPDYFIKDKNLFENIPTKYLICTQEILNNIIESPVPYFIVIMRNLRYTSGTFYPVLNFKRLYEILTQDGIALSNPMLMKMAKVDQAIARSTKKYQDKEREWNRRLAESKKLEKLRKMYEREEDEKRMQRRPSTDSIDLNLTMDLVLTNKANESLVLEFFTQHFLDIAKKSLKVATADQASFFTKQAFYLTKLLENCQSPTKDVDYYKGKIGELEHQCNMKADNIVTFRNQQINMTKIQQSYSAGSAGAGYRKRQSNIETKPNVHEAALRRQSSAVEPVESRYRRQSSSGSSISNSRAANVINILENTEEAEEDLRNDVFPERRKTVTFNRSVSIPDANNESTQL